MQKKEDYVVLVDEEDNPIGEMEKMEAHEKALLHRAFSIFVFNRKGEMLLQRRALTKYHSGGLWTNTCCSHPRPKESVQEAAHRRLGEEMGFDCELEVKFSFVYKVDFDNGLAEHEFDHVLLGEYEGRVVPNRDEVHETKYMSLPELRNEIKNNSSQFTFWFLIAFEELEKYLIK